MSGTTAPRRRLVLARLRRDILTVDRSAFSWTTAVRNTIGVVLPLVLGAVTGQFGSGLTAAIGALNVAFSDRPGPYRLRLARMLLTTLAVAVSASLGTIVAHTGWLDVLLLAVWGLLAGLLAAYGPASSQIGTAAVILLLVIGGQSARLPFSAAHAGAVLLLVGAGGLLQTALSVAAWPLRRFGPERRALANLFGQLAVTCRSPAEPDTPPAVTAAVSATNATLAGIGSDRGHTAELLRSLAADAERIRGEVLALSAVRARLAADPEAAQLVDSVLGTAAVVLVRTAGLLRGEVHEDPALPAYDMALAALVEATGTQRPLLIAAVRAQALRGQLAAALRLAGPGERAEDDEQVAAVRPSRLRLRDPISILRANLTWDSAVLRHALRLAATLLIGAMVAHLLGLQRGYWIGLTIATVLRPDFGTTFTRGLGRIAGTFAGLVIASGLAYVVHGTAAEIALIAVLVLIARLLGAANFALTGMVISGLVVVLTSLAGAPPEQTILERGLATLLGGALALAVYAAWPTWERGAVPGRLGDMLQAYRDYTGAVLAGWLADGRYDPARLDGLRRRARLTRSNAEASADRLRAEPGHTGDLIELAENLLAQTHRLALAALALEAQLVDAPPGTDAEHPELERFTATVERAYEVLVDAIRRRGRPRGMPDVRAAQRALVEAMPEPLDAPGAVLAQESDRVAHGLDTVNHLLRSHNREVVPVEPTTA